LRKIYAKKYIVTFGTGRFQRTLSSVSACCCERSEDFFNVSGCEEVEAVVEVVAEVVESRSRSLIIVVASSSGTTFAIVDNIIVFVVVVV
jgi:hypothetical protein